MTVTTKASRDHILISTTPANPAAMFLKQYNYKPRSGSIGSQGGSDAQAQAAQQAAAQQPAQPAENTANQGSVSAAAAGRRRVCLCSKLRFSCSFTNMISIQSSAGQFAGLQGYKRSSQDEARTSFSEQQQQSGVLGQMWNNFTKGK